MLQKTTRTLREWVMPRIHDIEHHLKSHDVELKVITDRVLCTDERLENHDELTRTFTEKIIKLDERISTLESSLDKYKLAYDALILSSNTKMCDLIEENRRLREELEQLRNKE